MKNNLPREAEVVPLSQEHYDLMLGLGCVPHCHVCNRELRVGDPFGLVVLAGSLADGRMRAKATACGSCIAERRPIPDAQEEVARRHREQDASASGRSEGCLFTVDGAAL